MLLLDIFMPPVYAFFFERCFSPPSFSFFFLTFFFHAAFTPFA